VPGTLSHETETRSTVASLGLVSPGAATDGCHPVISWKNMTTFLVIASDSDDFFLAVVTTTIFPSYLSSILSKFSHKKINFMSGVTPLVTPLETEPRPRRPKTPRDRLQTQSTPTEWVWEHICQHCWQLNVSSVGVGSFANELTYLSPVSPPAPHTHTDCFVCKTWLQWNVPEFTE